MQEIRLTTGKGDFVTRRAGDNIEKICLCGRNADPAKGCISQVPAYLFEEVIKNNGKYSEKTKEYWLKKTGKLPDLRCFYCYQKRKNGKSIEGMIVGDKTIEDFKNYNPEFVRLGKETEWGHPLYRKSLLEFIDLCTEYGSRIIFPTKMLEFNKEFAKKIRKNNGFLSFSIGNDRFELGPCEYGFTNKWRIKQGEKYFDSGVNTALTMVLDITSSIEENEKRGFTVEDVLNSSVPDRIIPIRLTSGKIALLATGIERKDLLNPQNAIGYIKSMEKYSPKTQKKIISNPYIKRGNNDLVANFVHPDFKEFEENLRICGQVGEYEYCDKCNLLPGKIKFPVSEIVEVDYGDKKKLQNKMKKTIPKLRKGMNKIKGIKKKNQKILKIDFEEE